MRKVVIVGLSLAVILLLGQALVFSAGFTSSVRASEAFVPALQTTATAVAEATNLPNTGADSNYGLLLLGGVALMFIGAATVLVLASRRETQS